eukprot:gene7918-12386_t
MSETDNYQVQCLGLSKKTIDHIIGQMRNPQNGLVLKNRVYRFKTYERCFLASEAIDWLRDNFLFTKEDSIKLLKYIQEMDVFEHVTGAHQFKEGYLFFQFIYPKKVVVLGGGIGGIMVAKSLEKLFKVTLIDKKEFFEYTPGRINSILKPIYLENVKKEYKKFLNSTFVQGEISQVTEQHVIVKNNGNEISLDFDYLVISTGCTYNELYKDLKFDRVIDIKKNLGYSKMIESSEIAILGGGPAGIEIATLLAEAYPYKKIYIISRNVLLKKFEKANEILVDYFSKNFKNLKFIKLNVVDIHQQDETVYLQGEHKDNIFKFDLVYLATGFTATTDFLKPYLGDYLNKFGHCKINQYFQLTKKRDGQLNSILKNIFAIGDVCAIKEDLLASNTIKHAKFAIENIKTLESECRFRTYTPRQSEMIIALGSESSFVIQNGISQK